MPKKRLIVVAFLAVLAGIVWLLSARPRPEPVYQGRRLTEWLADYSSAAPWNPIFGVSTTGGMYDAAEAIRAMGTNSLPFLLAHIHAYSPLEEKLCVLLAKQHIFKFNFDDPYFAPSVLALRDLGSVAAPAFPALLRKGETSPGSFTVMAAMVALGTNAIPSLDLLCESKNARTRAAAAEWLAAIRGPGEDSLTVWRSPTVNGRPTMMRIGCTVPGNLDALLAAMLQSPKPAIRRASADALAELSLKKPPQPALDKFVVLPPLLVNLKDPDAQVRQSAANALKLIDPVAAAKAGVK